MFQFFSHIKSVLTLFSYSSIKTRPRADLIVGVRRYHGLPYFSPDR